MARKTHKPEEIIGKLREVEIVPAQGASTAEAWAAVVERRLVHQTAP